MSSFDPITDLKIMTLDEWTEALQQSIYMINGIGNLSQTPTQQVWTYPDGSKTTSEPTDGQRFVIYNSIGVAQNVFEWIKVSQLWADITNPRSFVVPSNNYTTVPMFVKGVSLEPYESIIVDTDTKSAPICECGSETVGSSKHSDWCKKWSPSL